MPERKKRERECPAEFEWNAKMGKCVECRPGYYGLNCSKSCVKPFYGYGCQKKCSECDESLCDVSTGCPIYTESTESTKTTTILASRGGSLSTVPKQTSTASKATTYSSSKFNTLEAQKSTSFQKSTIISFLASTTATPSFFDSYYPVLLGIFGVSSLFLIIFTIYVSIHIHEKCSKRRKSKIPHKASVEIIETYQEINDFGTEGNIMGYDPLGHNRPSKKSQPEHSLELVTVVQSSVIENSTYQIESVNDYSEVKDDEQTSSVNPPICVTGSRYISSPSSQHGKLDLKKRSPSHDNDGYMLPNSEACGMSDDVGEELCSSPYTSPTISPSENYLDSADVNNKINEESLNVYLTVLPD
ncbi:uncharacterized protein LOC133173343 [Saccostrea echinata]|uniref:uncharacterized protein LOC133173343 n=1 Tax=Saccostrea echinata TaxID=191078 RepID=UPI002A7FA71F|nr:uncharacterized protein LOC133173343 [Saccostrea echinata]